MAAPAQAEEAAAEKAAIAALGLLQPLEALSLDANTLRTATAAAVTYCAAQGAASFADLVERASWLIVHTHRRRGLIALGFVLSWPWAVALRPPSHNPSMIRAGDSSGLGGGGVGCGHSWAKGHRPLHHQSYRRKLLDGLVAPLALKPAIAKQLLNSLKVLTPTPAA